MIQAIVYSSNTGFTKQYAYSLAVRLGLPIYNIKESKVLKDNTNIIYFSWLMGNSIVNLRKVNRFNILKYCVVGMSMYSEELIDEIKKINNLSELLYFRGGLRLYKLNLFYRAMISFVRKSLKKKSKKNQLSADEEYLLEIMINGSEYIDLNSLDILVEIIEAEKETLIC
ncbi:MAG: hypothetical protein ACI35S_04710 [Anaeroplasma sp.]